MRYKYNLCCLSWDIVTWWNIYFHESPWRWCQRYSGWDIVTFAAFLSSMWIVSAPDLKFRSSVKLSMIKFESGKSPIHLKQRGSSCSIWYESRFEQPGGSQVPEYTIYLTLSPSTLLFCTFLPLQLSKHPSGERVLLAGEWVVAVVVLNEGHYL